MSLTPPLPDRPTLLLDMDGTLLELAPTPAAVVVPPDLIAVLRRLRRALDVALAIVTGRPIDQVDALLGDAPYAVAGEHGAAIRFAPGEAIERSTFRPLPVEWLTRAEDEVASRAGTLLEEKRYGFVLHYRQAPEAGPALRDAAERIVGPQKDAYQIVAAHMAWEIRPRGVDKGSAVERLLERAPFAGRTPIYIGDDVTDEDGMRAARAAGGEGFRVAETFGTPSGVRDWLATAAAMLRPG